MSRGDRKLEDRVALITGGASGIGQATAERFAQEGAKVVIADLDDAGAAQVAQQIRDAGWDAASVEANVTIAADAKRMVDFAVAKYGQIDILFCSAGVLREAYLWEMTEEDFDLVMSVNLKGVWLSCKFAIPHMIERRSGVVLSMSSLGGMIANPQNAIYNASKAGVVMLTRVMAKELAPYRVRANCIAPITVQTAMTAAWSEEVLAANAEHIPLGRLIQPQEIAAAALFLCSEDSAMISGIPLVIDGGYMA
jgi:NAD(P)-dependent dehydrogenase (short-subunit alcohol dehydrogenase family)